MVRPSRSVRDAAHQVVRGGRDRDRLARPVEAARRGTRGRSSGSGARGSRGSERRVASRRPGGRPARPSAAAIAAGDDVARRELAVGVRVEHEAPAVLVDEGRALAAHGLGDRAELPGAASTVGWNWKNSRSVTRRRRAARRRCRRPWRPTGWSCARRARRRRRWRARRRRRRCARDELVGCRERRVDAGDATRRRRGEVDEEGVLVHADVARAHRATSAFSIAVPVASPPACRMRG